jgi:hypothetical protein
VKTILTGQCLPLLEMPRYEFHLSISPDKYLPYYRGTAKQVVVRCFDGLVIQFPASLLQQYVMPDGINGDFVLTSDDYHRGACLKRKAES